MIPLLIQGEPTTKPLNVLGMLQNLPKVAPFLATHMTNEECKAQLREYKAQMDEFTQAQGIKKPTPEMVEASFCNKVSRDCAKQFGQTFRTMFNQGGTVEILARGYFELRGVELSQIDTVILNYVDEFCGKTKSEKPQRVDL